MRSMTVTILLLASCGSSGLVVRGTVETTERQPLEGARISMSCPEALQESGLRLLATTDANGKTSPKARDPGQPIKDRCQIFVTADGYEHETFPIESVCARWAGTTCVEVALRAKLAEDDGIGPRGAIVLAIQMKRDGEVVHTQDLTAPQGSPATITLRNNGIPYELIVTPTWVDERTVSVEGTWSTGTGAQGVVNGESEQGQAITVEMSDGIVMVITPRSD